MSPSALPLYNTNKLIYKSGFFNKFKETLPIVSWFLRKEEKRRRALAGVREVRQTQDGVVPSGPRRAMEGLLRFQGGEDPARGPGALLAMSPLNQTTILGDNGCLSLTLFSGIRY